MTNYFAGLTDRGATPALVNTLVYNQARLELIAQNVANVHTPGYRAKQLDTAAFRKSLRDALETRRRDPAAPFRIRAGREARTDDRGSLKVTPSNVPVQNILFHDGTNLSIERQMADLAETGMVHELASTLLQGRLDGLRKAIRGTVA